MATEIAQNFYDKLRKHYETGVRWQDMNFTDEQKKRIEVCIDAYNHFANDPFAPLDEYIRNKWNRSHSELRNDKKVVEFIASFCEEGQRAQSTRKVRHAADILMRTGADTGNMKSLADGASLLFKLEGLDKPPTPEDIDANRAKMAPVFVPKASLKYPDKEDRDTEEMKRIRKKYGVKEDPWQEMIENDKGMYVPANEKAEEEEEETNEMQREEE